MPSMSVWLPALFGLLGVMLGGLINIAGNWISLRDKRIQQTNALRWDSCLSFLRLTDVFTERARVVYAAVNNKDGSIDLAELQRQHADAWFDLYTASPAVRLSCPTDVSQAAGRVKEAAAMFSQAIDDWVRTGRRPPKVDVEALRNTLSDTREKFADTAGKHVSANPPPTDRATSSAAIG